MPVESRSVLIESGPKLQILVLTRFLHANRYPPPDQVRGHVSLEDALCVWRSSGFLIRRFDFGTLWFGRRLCGSLGLCRLRVRFVCGLRGGIRLGVGMPDAGRFA